MTLAHKLLKLSWRLRGSRTSGAHALALTPERRIVLVKLRYAEGWRVPGGGRKSGEDPQAAALRELREEIGLIDHGRVSSAANDRNDVDRKCDPSTLHIVEDVCYRPGRWSLEVEQVAEFPLDALPPDAHISARRWIAQLRSGN